MNILSVGNLQVVAAEVAKVKPGDGKCSLLLKDKVYDPEQKKEVDRERWVNAFNREGGYPTADSCAKLAQGVTAVFSLYVDGDKCYVNSVRRAGILPLTIKKEGEEDEKANVLIGVACNLQTREVNKKDGSVTKVTYCSIPIHVPSKAPTQGGDEFETEWHRVSFWNSDSRPDYADKMATLLKNKPRVAILASEAEVDEWTNRNGGQETSYTHYGRRVEILPAAKGFKKEGEAPVENVSSAPTPAAEESPFEDDGNSTGAVMVGPVEDFVCTLSMKYQKNPTKFSEIVKDEKSKAWMAVVVKRMGEQVNDDPVEGTISTREQYDRIAKYIA